MLTILQWNDSDWIPCPKRGSRHTTPQSVVGHPISRPIMTVLICSTRLSTRHRTCQPRGRAHPLPLTASSDSDSNLSGGAMHDGWCNPIRLTRLPTRHHLSSAGPALTRSFLLRFRVGGGNRWQRVMGYSDGHGSICLCVYILHSSLVPELFWMPRLLKHLLRHEPSPRYPVQVSESLGFGWVPTNTCM